MSSAKPACIEHPFAPRPVEFEGVRELRGWKLKSYIITLPGADLDTSGYDDGLELAGGALPRPPVAAGRFGVGFLILHQAQALDYIVLGWWGRENELPIRVFVRDRSESPPIWRVAQGDESFCVWDAEVIWHERCAWVECVLSGTDGQEGLERYLARGMQMHSHHG